RSVRDFAARGNPLIGKQMNQDPRFSNVIGLCASGQFKAARQRLTVERHELQRADGLLFSALLADLDLQSGDLVAAQGGAEKLLRETQTVPIRATAYRI